MLYRRYIIFRVPALQMRKLSVSNLPKVRQLVKSRARIQTKLSPKAHALNLYTL